jgi:hypothetical protein
MKNETQLFSEISVSFFAHACLGIQEAADSMQREPRKSVSIQRTFGRLEDPDDLRRKCGELCDKLADDLAKEHTVRLHDCLSLEE